MAEGVQAGDTFFATAVALLVAVVVALTFLFFDPTPTATNAIAGHTNIVTARAPSTSAIIDVAYAALRNGVRFQGFKQRELDRLVVAPPIKCVQCVFEVNVPGDSIAVALDTRGNVPIVVKCCVGLETAFQDDRRGIHDTSLDCPVFELPGRFGPRLKDRREAIGVTPAVIEQINQDVDVFPLNRSSNDLELCLEPDLGDLDAAQEASFDSAGKHG
ncbi:hypothetical protein HG531_010725 [Fusarium graminearum]|nr:hypothetical protein HG531_010725 [Fusarium graminearum]